MSDDFLKLDCKFSLIIETDSYAGNFEREMCAFLTGEIGECEVGDEEASEFKTWLRAQGIDNANYFEDIISQEADDNGTFRPCSIWNYGSNQGYHDVAIFFTRQPSDDQVAIIKQRLTLWAEQPGAAIVTASHLLKVNKTVAETELAF